MNNCCEGGACRLPMQLLQAGVPLSLLVDLVDPDGPDSELIALLEGWTDDVTRRGPRRGLLPGIVRVWPDRVTTVAEAPEQSGRITREDPILATP